MTDAGPRRRADIRTAQSESDETFVNFPCSSSLCLWFETERTTVGNGAAATGSTMRKTANNGTVSTKRRSITAGALALLSAAVGVPAQAQDLSSFFKAIFSPPPAPAPVYQPFEYGPAPDAERPRPRVLHRPRTAPGAEAQGGPEKSKALGEFENPLPALLVDSTLEPGDMVMFPDGLRVFTGQPGSHHEMRDFKPVTQAGKAVSRETRKLVAQLRPGQNNAWSTAGLGLGTGSRLASNARDVATTGSLRHAGHRRPVP